MSNNTMFLKNIARPTNASADEFIAIAGEIKNGSNGLVGLKIGVSHESQKRGPDIRHNYMEIVKNIRIDNTYDRSYSCESTENKRVFSFSEALKEFNKVIGTTPELQEYLIHNIPKKDIQLDEAWTRGQGYIAKPELCTILHFEQSLENPEENIVLLYKDGKFAIQDGIKKNERGDLDFQGITTPKFEIENLQQILDEYVDRTRCEVLPSKKEEQKSNEDGIIPTKALVRALTNDINDKGISKQFNQIKRINFRKRRSRTN